MIITKSYVSSPPFSWFGLYIKKDGHWSRTLKDSLETGCGVAR